MISPLVLSQIELSPVPVVGDLAVATGHNGTRFGARVTRVDGGTVFVRELLSVSSSYVYGGADPYDGPLDIAKVSVSA